MIALEVLKPLFLFLIGRGLPKNLLKQILEIFKSDTTNFSVDNNKLNLSMVNITLINQIPPEIYPHIAEFFSSHQVGFMRSTNLPSHITSEQQFLENKDNLKCLFKVLNQNDANAIVLSYTVLELNRNGKVLEERNTYQSLMTNFGDRGKRIFNLIRGKYLDEILFDIRWDTIFLSSEPSAISSRYQTRFNKIIDYCENAIFVNESTSPHSLTTEIQNKYQSDKPVNIHFRLPNKSVVEYTIDNLKTTHDIEIEILEDGSILNRPAYIFIIKKFKRK